MGSVLYYFAIFLFTVAYFVLFAVLFLLTVIFDRQRVVFHYASIVWARGIFRLNPCWRVRVRGLENVERGRAYVVVSNHLSMMDIPLMYFMPLSFKWVAKKEVLRWPLFGLVMRMHGDIAIERGTGAAARKMTNRGRSYLDAGTSVIVFPEGTRSRSGRVGRFHEGAFLLAKAAGAAVLPCAIEGTGSAMKGWKVRAPHTFHIDILPPVPPDGLSPRELAQRTQDMILERHKELRKDLYT
jgi:1-acyl-sn-glycerol-3-phosphate acyltransferase